uniref:Uncharacterized protein n=1 Tax=Heterorhabditis bacteriophora TaxID=37862 RepID=A0A1I7W949_HETBA
MWSNCTYFLEFGSFYYTFSIGDFFGLDDAQTVNCLMFYKRLSINSYCHVLK